MLLGNVAFRVHTAANRNEIWASWSLEARSGFQSLPWGSPRGPCRPSRRARRASPGLPLRLVASLSESGTRDPESEWPGPRHWPGAHGPPGRSHDSDGCNAARQRMRTARARNRGLAGNWRELRRSSLRALGTYGGDSQSTHWHRRGSASVVIRRFSIGVVVLILGVLGIWLVLRPSSAFTLQNRDERCRRGPLPCRATFVHCLY